MPFLSLRLNGLAEARERTARWSPAEFAITAEGTIAPVIEEALKRFVAVKTGATRDSLATAFSGRHIAAYGNDVAGFLEWGTRPHLITGNPMLRFMGRDGQIVFRPWVQHPGTRPTMFAEEAAAFAAPEIANAARSAAMQVLGL